MTTKKKVRNLSGVTPQAQGQTMYAPTKKRNSLTAGFYKMFMRERKQTEKAGKDSSFEILPRYTPRFKRGLCSCGTTFSEA